MDEGEGGERKTLNAEGCHFEGAECELLPLWLALLPLFLPCCLGFSYMENVLNTITDADIRTTRSVHTELLGQPAPAAGPVVFDHIGRDLILYSWTR